MDVEHDRSAIEDPSAERLPEATPTHVAMGNRNIQAVISGKETCPLIVRASRVKKVVVNSAQSHQIHSYMRISIGCRRKPIASVKRNVDLGLYVVN